MTAEDRRTDLLARLTLRERVGQLNQRLKGWECVRRTGAGFEVTDVLRREVDRWGGLGALYGLFRADPWSGVTADSAIPTTMRAEVAGLVSEYVRDHSEHRIPPLLVEEAPHGQMAYGGRLFPVNLAIGASWDVDGARQAAALTAQELRASGVHIALLSGLDIARDPRWGRSEETYGEDPDLASAFVAAAVEGMNSVPGIGVVLKHFAGQGAGIGGRNASGAPIGPSELAEIHLPAALRGVQSGAVGLMAAYNDIDGVPCVANSWLLTDLLRDRWGFDGLVMADGGAIDRLIAITGSQAEAAATALRAGVDLSLWDESYTALESAVEQGLATEADVDRALGRVLGVKERLGLLDDAPVSSAHPDEEAASALALQLAERSIVRVKGTGRLPAEGTIAVLGPNADDLPALLGDYTPPIAEDTGGVASELSRRPGFEDRVSCSELRGRSGLRWRLDDADLELAGRADLVVAVLGDTSERLYTATFDDNGALAHDTPANIATSGEGADVASVELPPGQLELLERIAALGKPVVSVLVTGRARAVRQVEQLSEAVLFVPFPGPQGARAIADVLSGAVIPSGRLPVSLPAANGTLPVAHNERMESARGYLDVDGRTLPFGSAAEGPVERALIIEQDRITADSLLRGAGLSVRLELINTGSAAVREVVPIFGRRPVAGRQPRQRELITFVTAELQPGEQKVIMIELAAEQLLAKDRWGQPTVVPSELVIGLDSSTEERITITGRTPAGS